MKNLIQYLKLWQKKRGELQIDEDAGKDWLEMHALLDKHMPRNGDDTDGSSGKRGFNLLTMMLITLSAAATIYVTTRVVRTQIQAYHHKNNIHHKRHHGFNNGTDSLSVADSSQQEPDSVGIAKQLSANENNHADSASNSISNKLKNATDSIAEKITSAPVAGSTSVKVKNLDKNNVAANGSNTKPGNASPSDNNALPTNHGNTRTRNAPNNTGKNSVASNKVNTRSGNASLSEDEQTSIDHTDAGTKGASNKNHSSRQNRNAKEKDNATSKDGTSAVDDEDFKDDNRLIFLAQPRHSFIPTPRNITVYPIPNNYGTHQTRTASAGKNPKNKTRNPGNGSFDWGILIGANSNGSFTAKNLNSNFYGSLPIDIFPGAYVTYNVNPKWGIGTQITVLSPIIAKGGTYVRPYLNYTDSITTLKFKSISDSKKIYSVQLPIYAVYHFNKNIDFKGGSVISFPVKQFNTTTQIDSVSRVILTTSRYDQKTDFSALAGVSYRYKMIIFEASYLKGLKSHTIAVSDSLIHKATNNTFQFTIKLQLGGNKK